MLTAWDVVMGEVWDCWGFRKHQGNPLFLMCSPGRRVAALPRVGKGGTEAGTEAQGAVCCRNGGACQAAGIQGLQEVQDLEEGG